MLVKTRKSTSDYTYTPYAKKQGVFTDNYDATASKNNTAQLLPSLNKKSNDWQQSSFDYKEDDSFKIPLKTLLNTNSSNNNVSIVKKPKFRVLLQILIKVKEVLLKITSQTSYQKNMVNLIPSIFLTILMIVM